MRRLLFLLPVAVPWLCHAAEDPGITPREWIFEEQGKFTGTFVKMDGDKVHIALPNGNVRAFDVVRAEGKSLAYLQRQLCRLPERTSPPQVKAGDGPLLDLSADDLPAGPLQRWENRGRLTASFHPLNQPPVVRDIAGRKAVVFEQVPWLLPLQTPAMVADAWLPDSLNGGQALSVVAWLYSLGKPEDKEVFLSWQPLEGKDGTAFSYGSVGRFTPDGPTGGAHSSPMGSIGFPDSTFPTAGQWHQIAFVFPEGKEFEFKLYVDGTLAATKRFKRPTPKQAERLAFLGCRWGCWWDWVAKPVERFNGAIAKLQVYDRALSEQQVRELYGKPAVPNLKAAPPADTDKPAQAAPSYFTPEHDSVVTHPFPPEVKQNGYYGKYLEGDGHPIIGAADCPDEAMLNARRCVLKLMAKRPDVVKAMLAYHCACHLDYKDRGWGWSQFTCACYGAAQNMFADPKFYGGTCILIHEMGHQYHMHGIEPLEPDFRYRLAQTVEANRKEQKWIGDYGGKNMWENIAVWASAWVNDNSSDDAPFTPREWLRRHDPRLYHLLSEYWPGDTIVELHPAAKLQTDSAGRITAWGNNGGIEYWKPGTGWTTYPRTVGRFAPIGQPRLQTVRGVTAVMFSGADALTWNCKPWDALDGNRPWSVELWARSEQVAGDGTLLSWSTPNGHGARFVWDASDTAYEFPDGQRGRWTRKPDATNWHHIVYVFTGGGLADGPGACRVYVDGEQAGGGEHKLALPSNAELMVGAARQGADIGKGFAGAIAHVRVYNYDMHPLQVAEHYREESRHYRRESFDVAGSLLVDLDARALAPCPQGDVRPFYPQALGKGWLRSCANHGTLGGKLHNDRHAPETSEPMVRDVEGVTAVVFNGDDRMVSSFTAGDATLGSVEAWVNVQPGNDGTIMQWGSLTLSSSRLEPARWHHVVLTLQDGNVLTHVDGKRTESTLAQAKLDGAARLHVGAEWNGREWGRYCKGSLAWLRVHSKALSPEQIARNCRDGRTALKKAVAPVPPALPPLIDLDASGLTPGPVKEWANKGSAGGIFAPGTERETFAPSVRTTAGRKGVDFDGRRFLTSTFATPDGLSGKHDFSVVLRANSPRLPHEQTVASWGRRPGPRAEFNFGWSPKWGAFAAGSGKEFGFAGTVEKPDGFKHNAPLPQYWWHLGYTYSATNGVLRIYVDGHLNREERATLDMKPGERICLGGAPGSRRPDWPFVGQLAELGITDRVLNEAQLTRLATSPDGLHGVEGWLVRLDAKDLAEGELPSWPNKGNLGGAFETAADWSAAPVVETVAGRQAVTFEGSRTFLRSRINTPASVTEDRPFTVEMWVLNPALAAHETVFSLAPHVAMKGYPDAACARAADFCFGAGDDTKPAAFATGGGNRAIGWSGGNPAAGKWHHLACVYSGGANGVFTVFVDGQRNTQRAYYRLLTMPGFPMHIGASWNTATGAAHHFSGSLAQLRVYDYAKSEEEIARTAPSHQ